VPLSFPHYRGSRAGALVALAALLVACTGSATSPTPSPAPSASGPAACPQAPAVEGTPDGWNTSQQKPTRFPNVISAPSYCGNNRFLFSFLSPDNRPIGSPDLKAKVAFYDLGRDSSKPVSTADGTFIWAIEGTRGVYTAQVTFPESGVWGAEFTTSQQGAPTEVTRFVFEVQAKDPTVRVGDPPPSGKTPTAADVSGDLAKISTDTHPDPRFYELSVDQALAQHKPFVLVFATPAFCTSAQCGPTLNSLKTFAKGEPGVAFIHVEPYKLQFTGGRLQPVLDASGQLQATDQTDTWGLTSEPWIFVVGKTGIVTGSFALIASKEELQQAIAKAQ
jgi:hypothetical protein